MKKILVLLILSGFLMGCSAKKTYITNLDYYGTNLAENFEADPEVEKIIAPYRTQLSKKMDEVIAINPINMTKAKPNSTMGNWFCDELLDAAIRVSGSDVDFAIQNYGGLRLPALAPGEITVGKIYELMPFDNMLVILEMDGATMQVLLDRLAGSNGWPISRGLNFTIEEGKAVDIIIQGKDFDAKQNYLVALPDYIANGGDNMDFLKPLKRIETGVFLRTAVIDEIKMNAPDQELSIDKSERIFKK